MKRLTRYGHYAGEAKDIIIGRLPVVSQIAVPKIRAFSCGLMTDAMLKSGWLRVFCTYCSYCRQLWQPVFSVTEKKLFQFLSSF